MLECIVFDDYTFCLLKTFKKLRFTLEIKFCGAALKLILKTQISKCGRSERNT